MWIDSTVGATDYIFIQTSVELLAFCVIDFKAHHNSFLDVSKSNALPFSILAALQKYFLDLYSSLVKTGLYSILGRCMYSEIISRRYSMKILNRNF